MIDSIETGLTLNTIQPPHYVLTIQGSESGPLVTVKHDGTVEIHKHGADKEAAEVFWRSIHIYGQTIIQQRDALAAELAKYKNNARSADALEEQFERSESRVKALEAALRGARDTMFLHHIGNWEECEKLVGPALETTGEPT